MGIRNELLPRGTFSRLAAENGTLRTQKQVMYNLLVKCRDWFRIMNADLEKLSEIDGVLSRVRKST